MHKKIVEKTAELQERVF